MSQVAETIILVHGLWMHGLVFVLQKRWLGQRGFVAVSFSWPTVRAGLDQNAAALAAHVRGIEADRIHFVAHSLGGLLVLKFLAGRADPRLGRVVLMGAPCRDSHCARVLLRHRVLSPIVGATLRDWLAAPALPPPPGIEIGVLAGTRSLGLGRIIRGLPCPNDGVVAVEETRIDTASDTITLPVAHAQMLVSRRCADQAAAFINEGRFVHA